MIKSWACAGVLSPRHPILSSNKNIPIAKILQNLNNVDGILNPIAEIFDHSRQILC